MSTPPFNLEERLEALRKRREQLDRQRLDKFWIGISQAPPAFCPNHPDTQVDVDLELSVHLSTKIGQVTVSHKRCPKCADLDLRIAQARKLIARGVPERCALMTMETWDPDWEGLYAGARRAAKAAVASWVRDWPHPFLVILGKTGVGKTALAVAAARRFETHELRVLDVRQWLNELLALDHRPRLARIRLAKDQGVLILDDFGARSVGARDSKGANPFEADTISEVICHRDDKRLPTIITSNLSPKQFAGRLDDKAVSRIRGGRTLIDASEWPSYREADL